MKIKLQVSSCRLQVPRRNRAILKSLNLQPSTFNLQPSERAIALVITLILLSVTLIMAVAFMAVARRERNAVTTTTDTATARLAADAALAAAQAQVAASIFATPAAAYNFSLLVSTNYINGNGFDPGIGYPTNVNYDKLTLAAGGGPLNSVQLMQNISNLWFLPRAPVYVRNRQTGLSDFRFYLDLNRNGRFETNGVVAEVASTGLTNGNFVSEVGDPEWIGVLERPDLPHGPNNLFVARYAFIAVPVGNTLDLNYIHNQAVSKTADNSNGFLPGGVGDGFFRNQGVGSWEINLAAFLADLNTNQWLPYDPSSALAANYYQYNEPFNFNYNKGIAFDDARALLSWRYNYDYNSLATANQLFSNGIIPDNGIDDYSDGSLQTTLNTNADFFADNATLSWPGADNTNHFFSLMSDLADPAKSSTAFTNRLMSAGTNASTYNRYTFYRMLEQLGTDSSAESGKLNLNYSNAVVIYDNNGVATNIAIIPGAETNLVPWRALDFFTAAADRMLKLYTTNWFASNPTNYLLTYYNYQPPNFIGSDGYGLTNFPYFGMTNQVPSFGVGNIPVYVYGRVFYSPAVNRVIQLAANMYDATTTNFFPSVFRPIFLVTNQIISGITYKNVYISGYEQVVDRFGYWAGTNLVINPPLNPPLITPTNVTEIANFSDGIYNNQNAYGVPWIFGAKKGRPSFNQLYMVNAAQVTRKLEVTRNNTNNDATTIYQTNQMYVISVTNNVGISFWNSYSNNYPRPLMVFASDIIQTSLTNSVFPNGFQLQPSSPFVSSTNYIYIANIGSWPGSQWGNGSTLPPNWVPATGSFYYTNWSFNSLPDSIYRLSTGWLVPTNNQPWETNQPLWGLDNQGPLGFTTTNLLQAYILDGNNIVDYVQLRGPIDNTNIIQVLADPDYPLLSKYGYLWSTNAYQPPSTLPPYGVVDQILISRGLDAPPLNAQWKTPPADQEIGSFRGFFQPGGIYQYNGVNYSNNELVVQAPYTPTRSVYDYVLWQANDPLVHYMGGDLAYVDPGIVGWQNSGQALVLSMSPTSPGKRFQPWGWGNIKQMKGLSNVDKNPYNLALQDPLIWCPDNWDFSTNLYPTVGWIGRVHRGTSWQTVYLKSPNLLKEYVVVGVNTNYIGTNTWTQWTGDTESVNGQNFDAVNAGPLQDRLLFDLFTTAPNDNATHGQLSVNQTNLAAWSAVLGGVVTLTNSFTKPVASYVTNRPPTSWTIINPAGVDTQNSALWQIVTNINGSRNSYPLGAFTHVGDVLSVSLFSDKSPFLNLSVIQQQQQKGISDEVYEWLPQQMMGLLKCPTTPRYVVYCYGQTLRPAADGKVLSGPFFGLVTNYQVTAESAARAVIRVDSHPGLTGTNYTTTVESYNLLPPD
jgi:hypothetical protein